MKIVYTSDTHGQLGALRNLLIENHDEVGFGDVLVHAGDLTANGAISEFESFSSELKEIGEEFRKIIIIAGNSDWCCMEDPELARRIADDSGLIYLQDEAHEFEGVKFYGTPWTPKFGRWAFQSESEFKLKRYWAQIPDDTDVLITHGPPFGILDKPMFDGKSAGSKSLADRISKIRPKINNFGHIHEGYGEMNKDGCNFINASLMDHNMNPVNKPISKIL